jgi:metal-responsive CopG/Arc/MetJ family transcriptional regulator
MSAMTRRQVHFPDPLWDAARRIAEGEAEAQGRRVTASDIVRDALEQYVRTRERQRARKGEG